MQRCSSVLAYLVVACWALAGCAGSPSLFSETPVAAPPKTAAPSQRALPQASGTPPQASTPSAASAAVASSETDTALWSALRQGRGYVILFRHALAPGTGDPATFRLEDCATQRNLSAAGRQQAVQMGKLLQQQNIPVSRVLSSQWCRCLETAELMNVAEVEPTPFLNSFFQEPSREDAQTEQLRQFILENRDSAGVTVMVTHQVNITAISDIVPQSGAAVVLRALSPDQVELVGQLQPL